MEVVASLLALLPFIAGIPLLGKQFDISHKALDAARYAVWERTVWPAGDTVQRGNARELTLEIRDRVLGEPVAGLLSPSVLRTMGVSENSLWRDSAGKTLIDYRSGRASISAQRSDLASPVTVGRFLVPILTSNQRQSNPAAAAVAAEGLQLSQQTFAHADVAIGIRHTLRSPSDTHDSSVQQARAAILSDAWSAHDEAALGSRVDRLTADEFIETIELSGRLLAMQAPAKGNPLYGEGQFAAGVNLRPASTALPAAYVKRQ